MHRGDRETDSLAMIFRLFDQSSNFLPCNDASREAKLHFHRVGKHESDVRFFVVVKTLSFTAVTQGDRHRAIWQENADNEINIIPRRDVYTMNSKWVYTC